MEWRSTGHAVPDNGQSLLGEALIQNLPVTGITVLLASRIGAHM